MNELLRSSFGRSSTQQVGQNFWPNKKILEAAILFILLVEIFQTNFITNLPLMFLTATSFLFFLGLSLPVFAKFSKIRFLCFLIIVISLYSFLLADVVADRIAKTGRTKVSDAAKVTEVASLALLEAKNPYSISYEAVFEHLNFSLVSPSVLNNYPYSPFMFLSHIPFFVIAANFLGFVDLRIFSVVIFLISAVLATSIVSEKLLFLIIFLLNPIFIPKLFFGASDILPLFLLFTSFIFLYYQKTTLATVALGLATASKLTSLPFAILYFLYIFVIFGKQPDRILKVAKQFGFFILTNLLVYLPFLIWNAKDLIEDVALYHLETRLIGGFLGLPQLLVAFGAISRQSTTPFYLLVLPASAGFLFLANVIFAKWQKLPSLILLSVLYFVLFFFFSRILQTDYLAFLSQILLLGAFVKTNHHPP